MTAKRIMLYFTFTLFLTGTLLVEANDCPGSLILPRPPPFPDIMESFIKSLNIDNNLLFLHDTIVEDFTHHEVCNCTAAVVEDWEAYNNKCDPEEPVCPEPTTTTEEPATTTTEEPSTTAVEITTVQTTITKAVLTTIIAAPANATVSKPMTTATTTKSDIPVTATKRPTAPRSQTPTRLRTPSTISPILSTTSLTGVTDGDTEDVSVILPTAPRPVTSGKDDTTKNIIIASVCGGALALIIVVITFCYARKRPIHHVRNIKAEKLARQRSDCQPLPENEGFGSVPHTPLGKQDSIGGYSNKGFNWQNGDGMTLSSENKQILLQDKKDEDFHYSTLKAMDHPHALIRSGFGESSTDKTLTKKSKKKHRGSKHRKSGSSTDANHNPKDSVGKNSTHSTGSGQDKGSVKSAGSIKGKGSIGKETKRKNSIPEEPPRTAYGLIGPRLDSPDELLDGKNEHLFSYSPPNLSSPSLPGSQMISSSLQGSELILAPPPEFQDSLKSRNSAFSSADLRRSDDPPTAVVRPMDMSKPSSSPQRQTSHSSAGSSEKKSADEVSISMEDMTGKVYVIGDESTPPKQQKTTDDEDMTPKPKSFLWSSPKKSSPDIIPKINGGIQKTVM